jgi:hypothetical protein
MAVVNQKIGGNSKSTQLPSAFRTMYPEVSEAKIITTLSRKSHMLNFLGFMERVGWASSEA